MTEERRQNPDRRINGNRREDDDWVYMGPERRRQAADRRQSERDRRDG